MSNQPIDVLEFVRSGADALRRGDARKARESFERIVASGQADGATYLGLAFACRSIGDRAAALAAVEKVLAVEPRNLRALIFKADHLAESGDARGASSFYRFATEVAPPLDQMPAVMRDELRRAQSMCAGYAGQIETFLRDRLAGQGLGEERAGARVRQALDILMGKKTVYHQQPQIFYFPELPQVQFYDRDDFPWLDKVENATADIRTELAEILKQPSSFHPYVQRVRDLPHKEMAGLDDNPDWSAFYLWKDGEFIAENAARCPRTMEVIAEIPLTRVKQRSPSVLFSLLRPGARIPPHTGLTNTRLICHLPLIVPQDCGFRVGNDTRTPVEGKAWVFDDTIEHEAWNRSDRARVILLFEIWRPELTEDERRLVAAMFEAIDDFSGQKPEWSV